MLLLRQLLGLCNPPLGGRHLCGLDVGHRRPNIRLKWQALVLTPRMLNETSDAPPLQLHDARLLTAVLGETEGTCATRPLFVVRVLTSDLVTNTLI